MPTTMQVMWAVGLSEGGPTRRRGGAGTKGRGRRRSNLCPGSLSERLALWRRDELCICTPASFKLPFWFPAWRRVDALHSAFCCSCMRREPVAAFGLLLANCRRERALFPHQHGARLL